MNAYWHSQIPIGNAALKTSRKLATPALLNVFGYSAAALVGLFGTAIVLMTLERGAVGDEFVTMAWTAPGTSPREFLRLMAARDMHPLLYYGMTYLMQIAGTFDLAMLRSINLLGLPLVIFSVAYGIRHKSVNLAQGLIVWILFVSSPIFFDYFAVLRCYFLLYAASIATSVLWYVLVRRINAGHIVSRGMILVWAACLAIFVNLHYFATIFGGMLTAALLARLAFRHSWPQVLLIAGMSLAAAAPALIFGALQVFLTPRGMMSWLVTSPNESIQITLRMIENAIAWNLVAVAGAIVMCLFVLEDRRKWDELGTAVTLLAIVALFLVALVLINAIAPLMVDRYLIASAGAITFSVAILAASSGAPLWLPTAAGAIALLLQAQTLRSNLAFDATRGWLPSARAVAQLNSQCPTTKTFAYPAYHNIEGFNNIDIALKINLVSYGYYANKFHFSYEVIQPGATISASGACPSVLWVEHMFKESSNENVKEVLSLLHINAIGVADLKRYGSGAIIIVRDRLVSTGK